MNGGKSESVIIVYCLLFMFSEWIINIFQTAIETTNCVVSCRFSVTAHKSNDSRCRTHWANSKQVCRRCGSCKWQSNVFKSLQNYYVSFMLILLDISSCWFYKWSQFSLCVPFYRLAISQLLIHFSALCFQFHAPSETKRENNVRSQ